MSLDDTSDEELVRRFRSGESGSFDAIVHRFQDRIFRQASVCLYDNQQAADVTQEVFLRSFKGLKGFRFRSAPYTWLYRMTKNVCSEFNRKRRTEALNDEPVEDRRIPEREATQFEAARMVRELVSELPQRQREVVLLRVFEELPVRETAKIMGCREGTVKALLHKATAKLRLKVQSAGLSL